MNYKKLHFLISIFAALALTVSSVSAQQPDVKNNRIGTAAASELLIPVGSRAMAMAGATIATTTGVNAIHWNPAGLGHMDASAEGMFSTMSYIADITTNYGAIALNFGGFGKLAFSVKALDFGDIPLTTTDDPEGFAGRTFSPTFINVGLTYARQFTDAIAAGVNFKIISESMQRVAGNGFAVDVGVQYHGVAGFDGVNLGVAIKNFGPRVNFDGTGLLRQAQATDGRRPVQYYASEAGSFELPSSVEIGLAYENKINDQLSWNVAGAYENNNLALDGYKVGGEVSYNVGMSLALAGRAGIEANDKAADDADIFGPSFGFGLTYMSPGVDITIDYAYRSVDYFNNNNMFGIRLGF